MITLPFPSADLSPNARLHWRKVATAKKAARADGHKATLEMPLEARRAVAEGDGLIPVQIRFYPPDKRRRDSDNMIASLKAAMDGIADALGVNDRRFRPHYFFEEPEKPGRVVVEFGA